MQDREKQRILEVLAKAAYDAVIDHLRANPGTTQEDLAAQMGYQLPYFNNVINGHREMKAEFVIELTRATGNRRMIEAISTLTPAQQLRATVEQTCEGARNAGTSAIDAMNEVWRALQDNHMSDQERSACLQKLFAAICELQRAAVHVVELNGQPANLRRLQVAQ